MLERVDVINEVRYGNEMKFQDIPMSLVEEAENVKDLEFFKTLALIYEWDKNVPYPLEVKKKIVKIFRIGRKNSDHYYKKPQTYRIEFLFS